MVGRRGCAFVVLANSYRLLNIFQILGPSRRAQGAGWEGVGDVLVRLCIGRYREISIQPGCTTKSREEEKLSS